MPCKKIKSIFLLLFSFWLTSAHAQDVVLTTGGNASGSGGSVSYSIGQVVFSTITGANGSIVQGVQQPIEISVVSEIDDNPDIVLQCSVYPNPTTNNLTLKFKNFKPENWSYQLYDINGNLLENKKVEGDETKIMFSNLAPAIYFLKVSSGRNEIKTFKVIKN